jgi:hypothetical protein
MKRVIVESVIGYKVRSESRMGLTEDPSYKVETKAAAVIKGIKVDKMIYDKDKDIALCFGHIDIGDVVNVVGELVRFKGVTVEGFGFGTMTEAAKPPLMALRPRFWMPTTRWRPSWSGRRSQPKHHGEFHPDQGRQPLQGLRGHLRGLHPQPGLKQPQPGAGAGTSPATPSSSWSSTPARSRTSWATSSFTRARAFSRSRAGAPRWTT